MYLMCVVLVAGCKAWLPVFEAADGCEHGWWGGWGLLTTLGMGPPVSLRALRFKACLPTVWQVMLC